MSITIDETQLIDGIENEYFYKMMLFEKKNSLETIFVHNNYVDKLIHRNYFKRKKLIVKNINYYFSNRLIENNIKQVKAKTYWMR